MRWTWVNLATGTRGRWSEREFRDWHKGQLASMKEVIQDKLYFINDKGWNYVFIHESLLEVVR